ncbi:hypothetical protein GQR58_007269 [Nymphon striatum]|nr:hypothetical protein GQR58_007269 [Nymphon striatum]
MRSAKTTGSMRNISHLPDTYEKWVRNRPYAAQMVEVLYQLTDMDDSTNSRKCLRPIQIEKFEKTVRGIMETIKIMQLPGLGRWSVLAGVSSTRTKFHHLFSHLPEDLAALVLSDDTESDYDALKIVHKSKQQRINEIPNGKPPQWLTLPRSRWLMFLLRRGYPVATEDIDPGFLKQTLDDMIRMSSSRIPKEVQSYVPKNLQTYRLKPCVLSTTAAPSSTCHNTSEQSIPPITETTNSGANVEIPRKLTTIRSGRSKRRLKVPHNNKVLFIHLIILSCSSEHLATNGNRFVEYITSSINNHIGIFYGSLGALTTATNSVLTKKLSSTQTAGQYFAMMVSTYWCVHLCSTRNNFQFP